MIRGTKHGAALTPDAAMVLGIASTAMPFARSAQAQAERWLRVLRMHGKAGAVLTELGVSEAPLDELLDDGPSGSAGAGGPEDRDIVAHVTGLAARIARQRRASTVGTVDVLVAAMHAYGAGFDHVLEAHGANRAEVMRHLGLELARLGGE